jgi:hypothetical protein
MTISNTAYTIISALNSGLSTKEIITKHGFSAHTIDAELKAARRVVSLPTEKRTFQACAADINSNLNQYEMHVTKMAALEEAYQSKLHTFSF